MKETNFLFLNGIVLELKDKPEGEPDSSDEEEAKKKEDNKPEEAEASNENHQN